MKNTYTLATVVALLFTGSLLAHAQQVDPPSLQLDAGPAGEEIEKEETRTVQTEIVSMELSGETDGSETTSVETEMVSMDLSGAVSGDEVGGDGEDIGAPKEENKKDGEDKSKGTVEATRKIEEGTATPPPGIEHEDIGVAGEDPETTAADMFLKIKGIDGESTDRTDDGHKDWIIIESAADGGSVRMNKADLISDITSNSDGGFRGYIKIGDIEGEADDAPAAKSSKPREIVVVGSKVRGNDVPQLVRPDEEESSRSADSFFDVFVDISTDEDLGLHAVSVAQNDRNIKEISITEQEVRVDYNTKIRLLGFIPLTATRSVTVPADPDGIGRVKVKLPWWHIFGIKEVSQNDLEKEINDELQAIISETEGDADDRPTEEVALYYNKISARVLQTISNVSKMLHDTAKSAINNVR